MADEPDNLILRMLREIRASVDEVRTGVDELRTRQVESDQKIEALRQQVETFRQQVETAFDAGDERFEELRHVMNHSIGLGASNEIRWRDHNARLKDTALWRSQTDDSIAALERRVGKLEEQDRS